MIADTISRPTTTRTATTMPPPTGVPMGPVPSIWLASTRFDQLSSAVSWKMLTRAAPMGSASVNSSTKNPAGREMPLRRVPNGMASQAPLMIRATAAGGDTSPITTPRWMDPQLRAKTSMSRKKPRVLVTM